MDFYFKPINAADAQAIAQWHYPDIYERYNLDANNWQSLLDPQYNYYSIRNAQNELIGFCCFGEDARVPGGDYSDDALDIGAGFRPDFTGQGHGGEHIAAIVDFAIRQFAPTKLRATIAAFNQRAIRACEKAGFQRGTTFTSQTEHKTEFLQMNLVEVRSQKAEVRS